MDFDLIIIGAGPAGFSASIYASRYKINHIIIGELPGGLMSEAHKICNYPSEIEISGFDLTMKMKAHVDNFGVQTIMDRVRIIEKIEGGFYLETVNGKTFKAKTILLATGTVHNHLGLPREIDFVGRGISYCATCDAMFYKNKIAAVIGGGNSAMTAALYLAEFADEVYQIVRGDKLKGETVWADQIKSNPKIKLIFKTNVVGLEGDEKLKSIKLDNDYNGSKDLLVDGLFVEIGSTPNTSWLGNLNLEIDNFGYVVINKDQSSSHLGVWAAGDISNGSNGLHQIVTACAEGSIASGSIFRYLQENK